MKTQLFLVLAILAVVSTVAVPSFVGRGEQTLNPPGPEARGELLLGDASSFKPCRIVVEAGLDTRTDRGLLPPIATTKTLEGGFRYWEEPIGKVLYVYDDVQNLVGRVVNPRSVRVFRAP